MKVTPSMQAAIRRIVNGPYSVRFSTWTDGFGKTHPGRASIMRGTKLITNRLQGRDAVAVASFLNEAFAAGAASAGGGQ